MRRIGTGYNNRMLVRKVTSYNNAAVGSGDIVNQVEREYNDFRQLITEYQSQSGAVVTSTTPSCSYEYEDGASNSNQIRPKLLTYPSNRETNYGYGSSGSMNDKLNRIASLIDDDGSTHLADYKYLGLGGIVHVDYTEPKVKMDLWGETAGSYSGLDQFGRVVGMPWIGYGSSSPVDLVRIQHGYDPDSNRLWRANPVALSLSSEQDQLYSYDGINRLSDMKRGTLDGTKTGMTTLKFEQRWALDAVGNWNNFKQDTTGAGSFDLTQTRANSQVNEILDITNNIAQPAWVQPAYDSAGNMTTMPGPDTPTHELDAVYDAWNRMVKVDGVAQYAYDGLNRRGKKITYDNGDVRETRYYFHSAAWQVLEERVDNRISPDRQFIWGLRYIDDLVLRDRDTTTTGTLDERFYCMQDPNFNAAAICGADGVVKERYEYDAYGLQSVYAANYGTQSYSVVNWETGYAGYRLDTETGLNCVRNRYLHVTIGGWTSRDPVGYADGLNLFAIGGGNGSPVNGTDPTGTVTITPPATPLCPGIFSPIRKTIVCVRRSTGFRSCLGGPAYSAGASNSC